MGSIMTREMGQLALLDVSPRCLRRNQFACSYHTRRSLTYL